MMRLGLALIAACGTVGAALAQDAPPAGAGPRGTSGEVREDGVGYATLLRVSEAAAPTVRIAAMHSTLPTGSFVEVTALDSGRTIAAMVVGPYRGRALVALSPDAAQVLGIAEGGAVRVRAITPSPQDQAALRSGQAASSRLDAPPALLTALRRELPGGGTARATAVPASRSARPIPTRPTPAARPAPMTADEPTAPPAARAAPRDGYGVQVAALSSQARAAALARSVGGHVVAAGSVYRVQLGPFANAGAAARARDGVAREGYRDARVFHSE